MRRSIRNQKSSDESNPSNHNTVLNHGKPLKRSSISTRSSKGSMELSLKRKRPLSIPNSPAKAANSVLSKRQNINNLPLQDFPGKINPNPSHKIGPTLRENTANKGTNPGLAIDGTAKNVFLGRRANAETKKRQKAKAKSVSASYTKAKGRGRGKAKEVPKSKVSSSVSNKLKGLPTTDEAEEEEKHGNEYEHVRYVDGHVGQGGHGNVDGHLYGHRIGHGNGHVHGHGKKHVDIHGHGGGNVHGHGHGHGKEHIHGHAGGHEHGHVKEHVDIHGHGHGHGHGKEHVDIHGHGDVSRIQRLKRSRDLIVSHVNERVFKRLKMVPSRIHNTVMATSPRTTLMLTVCAIFASIGAASYFYHLKKLKEQRARTLKWW